MYRLISLLFIANIFFVALVIPATADAREPVKIIIFGDTFSSGYEIGEEYAYPSLFMERSFSDRYLNIPINVINRSHSGDTATSALTRLPSILQEKPDIVVIALGGVDALNNINPSITYNALEQIISNLRNNRIYTLLIGYNPSPNKSMEYRSQFTAMYKDLATRYQINLIPDLLAGMKKKPNVKLYDSPYPNERGHQFIANKLYPNIARMVKKFVY